jgi:2-polyprenyl-3-methyl-5-hydroxy-6-metoxy-1,4-benzoquinol methylase
MIGLTGLPSASIPFTREKRATRESAYTGAMRLKTGLSALYHTSLAKKKVAQAGQQRRYYARADHKSIYPENYPHYIQKQIAKTLGYLPIEPEKKVLEIGAGMGRFTLPLAEKGMQIEALDISPDLLKKLNELAPDIPTHCLDFLSSSSQLPGSYDAIIGYFILHHLPDMEKTFTVLSSLLKPGGKIFFVEPNPQNLLYYVQILLHPKMRWKSERYMLKMRPKYIKSHLSEFSEFQTERYGFFPPFLHEKAHKLEAKLEKFKPFKPFLPYQVFSAQKRTAP